MAGDPGSRRYALLLRGVNVGGRGKLAMADLRAVLVALGHTDVSTYLQSGNAVFTAPTADPAGLARRIEGRLAADLGMAVEAQVWTPGQIAAVISANPYPAAAANPTTLHVIFLPAAPDRAALDALERGSFAPDEFTVGERVVYLHCPGGIGRSKLGTAAFSRAVGPPGTVRNWRTVTALAALLAE